MKKIIITLLVLTVLAPNKLSAQDKEDTAAIVAGVAAIAGLIIVGKSAIKEYEKLLERDAVDHVLDNYGYNRFNLNGYRLTKESEKKFDPSDVQIKIFGLEIYKDYSDIIDDRFVLLRILSYGWWDIGSPTYNIKDFKLLTREEWFDILTIYLSMASDLDVTREFLRKVTYVPKKKKKEFEKYDLSDSNVKPLYAHYDNADDQLLGIYVFSEEDIRKLHTVRTTKKGAEHSKKEILLFKPGKNLKTYEAVDFSEDFKIVSTNRSLGLFLKNTGELVLLDEDAVNAITMRFHN